MVDVQLPCNSCGKENAFELSLDYGLSLAWEYVCECGRELSQLERDRIWADWLFENVRPIPDYPGYLAFSNGRIYSELSGKFLKPSDNGEGYLKVCLVRDGKRTTQKVHRLVAAAFLGPAEGRSVLHGPGGSHDNSVGNLRYGTHMENMADWVRESHGAPLAVDEGYVPLLSKRDVIEISLAVADGLSDRVISEQFMIPEGSVQAIALGTPGSYRPL